MKPKAASLVRAPERPVHHADVLPAGDDPRDPVPGRWFWVTEREGRKKKRWLGCVTHVGSNYAEVQAPSGGFERIHEEKWRTETEPELDARAVIGREIDACRGRVHGLLAEVYAITARLGVPLVPALGPAAPGAETSALALRAGAGVDMGGYKKALAKAKEKDLPVIFKKIEEATSELSTWMGAELLPLKAQKRALDGATEAIEERIFSVELYAGLTEEVALIRGGEAAAREEPVRLLQRKCFMDEESLARYEAGGMEFSGIGDFDAWLARPENLDRILPFPRSVVAFQVRREQKEREFENLREFFAMLEAEKLDKLTFLYIRNGARLYRVSTAIDFGERLFPDMDAAILRGDKKLYADTYWGDVRSIITEDEYEALIAEEKKKEEEIEGLPEEERRWRRDFNPPSRKYEAFTRESVHYDDISEHIQSEMKRHNRIVLVLQGLLDRSPVFHPHPPWSLWKDEGFREALQLVYDDTHALVAGDKPDFEAYRAAKNASIAPGMACVGQEDYWEEREAERYNDRMDRSYHRGRDWRPKRYRPPGDPGPGRVARALSVSHKKKTATFAWERERSWNSRGDGSPVRCTIEVPFARLLSADAYEPGDYRRFFDDPRTRAEYLRWAPLLLTAEDYRAKKREAQGAVAPKPQQRTVAGARRYRLQKRRNALVGKAVRLARGIEMRSGKVHPKGSLFRVTSRRGGDFAIRGISEDGRDEQVERGETVRFITNAQMEDLVVDDSVPAAPVEQVEDAEDSDEQDE